MAPAVSAASVYSNIFKNKPDPDAFKRPKTKVRKGKHFKKEMKKQRKIKKQQRILKGRLRNESVLLSNLKEAYPGIANIAELASKVKVVEDTTGKKIDKEKVDKALKRIISKMDVFQSTIIKANDQRITKSGIKDQMKRTVQLLNQKEVKKNKRTESSTDTLMIKSNKTSKRTAITSTTNITKSKKSKALSSQNLKDTFVISEISSEEVGKQQFQWILGDIPVDNFFRDHWEKKPLLVSRKQETYYNNLVTSTLIDQILREDFIEYTKNIDITSYTDGQRETLNPEGRALPEAVWDYYQNGCSMRFLNPQTYIKPLQALNASLQELFGCFVGANTYLTPANSQGFAPHYDDIEAFILQLEGRKKWKVYAPRSPGEYLPRYSSPNFREEDIGSPILEVILHPGDLLYLPRGYIHQACTVTSHHSLHVTISVYQKTAWIDLLEKALPKALQVAAASNIEFRRGLPLGYLKHAGLSKQEARSEQRKLMKKTLKSLVTKLVDVVDLDVGVDEMGLQLMHDALPPVLNKDESKCTVYEKGMRIENGVVINASEPVHMSSNLRLIRANACRLVEELNEERHRELRLYYTLDNSLEYRGKDPQFLILPPVLKPVALQLFSRYPAFTSVEKLIRRSKVSEESDVEECVQVLKDLWERGILMTDTAH